MWAADEGQGDCKGRNIMELFPFFDVNCYSSQSKQGLRFRGGANDHIVRFVSHKARILKSFCLTSGELKKT